jgi:small redox-active disulfide protein 2
MKNAKIRVLGMGCPQCRMLFENAKKAARDLGLDFKIIMAIDIDEFRRFGMSMITPALIIDGKIEIAGKVASVEEIKDLLMEKLSILG